MQSPAVPSPRPLSSEEQPRGRLSLFLTRRPSREPQRRAAVGPEPPGRPLSSVPCLQGRCTHSPRPWDPSGGDRGFQTSHCPARGRHPPARPHGLQARPSSRPRPPETPGLRRLSSASLRFPTCLGRLARSPPGKGAEEGLASEDVGSRGPAGEGTLTRCWCPFHRRCRTRAAASLLPSEQPERGREEPPSFVSSSESVWEGPGGRGAFRVCRKSKVRRMTGSGMGAEKLAIRPGGRILGCRRSFSD